ncbi:transposase [Bacillus sp. TE9106W]
MFIDYNKNQLTFPLDVEVYIPEHHLSRVVHTAVEAMDLSILLSRYPGGGRPPYHPKMMLKILLYAYAKGIYSSRKIKEQLHEIFISCGFLMKKHQTFVRSIVFDPSA